MSQVTVHIKQQVISCTPNGGNLRTNARDEFRWSSPDAPFTLVFTDFVTGQKLWPFQNPEPTWPVKDTDVLNFRQITPPKYYKYTVQCAGLHDLDPIIVVDN
jgi:hypothetical protein